MNQRIYRIRNARELPVWWLAPETSSRSATATVQCQTKEIETKKRREVEDDPRVERSLPNEVVRKKEIRGSTVDGGRHRL